MKAPCRFAVLRFWVLLVVLSPVAVQSSTVDPYEEVNASWERFGAVYTRILENYYADLDQKEIMRAAIEGMLEELDSYSQFYDEEGLRQLRQDTSGKFAGLGITVGLKDHYPVVISPIEDTPAFRAGLKPGDLIVAIEGKDTYDLTLDEVVDILRGEPDTTVRIRVSRKGGPPAWDVVITREIIKIKSVVLVDEIQPGIGYISMRQSRFSEDTAGEVERGLKSLKEKGVKGMILDLRGNPGGLLSQATQVADLFLPKGAPIVTIRERDGRRKELKRSQRNPVAEGLLLAVLIDAGSASASEIVAGAIQDNDRGVVLGTTSFGKGSVQTIFDILEAENSALKLTTALYYTPSGRSIHREGFTALDRLPPKVQFGEVELPAGLVLDLILRAPDRAWAATSLRNRFDLGEVQVEQVLSTPLRDLMVNRSAQIEGEGISQDGGGDSVETFYTLKGRKVYGKGGIAPDIKIEPVQLPSYILELERHRLFFDFAVDYVARDSLLAESGVVPEVDQVMLEEFSAYFSQDDSSSKYGKIGRRELEKLKTLAEEMGWTQATRASIDSLEVEIEKELTRVLTPKLEPYMRTALQRELTLRLKGRPASLRTGLEGDAQLDEAVRLLQNAQRYNQVLQDGAS